MRKVLLFLLAGYFSALAVYIFLFPRMFYDLTPGLSAMGPFNFHFIIDISFVFLVSGGALAYGAFCERRDVLLIGAAWPFLHALFHCYIWFGRGLPFDFIWASDFSAVILPGFLAFGLALARKDRA